MDAQALKNAVLAHQNDITYLINKINPNGSYRGWVSDFGFTYGDNPATAQPMQLDLSTDTDLFLLFVLASAWSRTGPWENAAILTAYLKHMRWSNYQAWTDIDTVNGRREEAQAALLNETFYYTLPTRRKVAFRSDTFTSIGVLANHWNDIFRSLIALRGQGLEGPWIDFMNDLRIIEGLGVGTRRMMIKIPLILRELRCGGGDWANIPGRLCCVADARVIEAAGNISGMPILNPQIRHTGNPIGGLINASTAIYENFGDLYDIPLFAYEDVVH